MYQNPTYQNPAQQNLQTLLDLLKRDVMKNINAVKVGEIQSFDAGAENLAATVTVRIAQQQVTRINPDGTRILAEYPILLKCPVFFPSGGGFTLTFPIAEGDECIILFNDRELDNWLVSGAGQAPSTGRVHDLSDGIALVGIRSNPHALLGISTTTTQLRSDDGKTYVEVAPGVLNLVAPTSINLTAPTINLNASDRVTITSPITDITGVLDVLNIDTEANPCTVHGNIVTDGDVIANGVSLEHHLHSDAGGTGNSGPPIP